MNTVELIREAHRGRYAVGAFSARSTRLIRPIVEAAMLENSPVLIQLSENEIAWFNVTLAAFAKEFFSVVEDLNPGIPVRLHLDHTRNRPVIQEALDCGFHSVMIDASDRELSENIAVSGEIAELAHSYGAAAEAELGRIGTTDFIETDEDVTRFTDPEEVAEFAAGTGIDFLAVSVGTAHGLYSGHTPRIELPIIRAINECISIPLVLHGGSGVSDAIIAEAVSLEEGGISKVNIASELEHMMRTSLKAAQRLSEPEINEIDERQFALAGSAVAALVAGKIRSALLSAGKGSVSKEE